MLRPGEEKPYIIKYMQHRQFAVTSLFTVLTCAVLALGAAQSRAADATGTWSWTTPGRNGGEGRKMTLKLKADGEKLTGTMVTPGRQGGDPRETAIGDGKIKGDEISFTVTREFNNNKMVQKYSGKVSADTIKGKTEFERNGETQSRDWEAKREADKK
jgi:hypothetical protein